MFLALFAACRSADHPGPEPDTPDASDPWPPPRTDLVSAVGSPSTVDIATWNIENYPKRGATPALAADLIASMDLDLIAVQEISDIAAFDELVARLPGYAGILSEHVYSGGFYQKLGFIYRTDVLEASPHRLLFPNDYYAFPRPALEVHFTVLDESNPVMDFLAIAIHLKAGSVDENGPRRAAAVELLDGYIRTEMASAGGEDEIVLLGDYNERLDTAQGQPTWTPLLSQPDLYRVHTQSLDPAMTYTYIPSQVTLDHITSTSGLDDELAGVTPHIPALDTELLDYEVQVSDHLPVVISMPMPVANQQ